MRAAETIEQLAGFEGRGAGRDGERRAAVWLATRLCEARPQTVLETFWCRPEWAFAQSWHVALGIAGSLLAVSHPQPGAILLLVAALCVLADIVLGVSPGRRLTPERASQNLVSPGPVTGPEHPAVELILTANLDAGRAGLVHRAGLRRGTTAARALLGGRAPGWAAWLELDLIWALLTALLRLEGIKTTAVAANQIGSTIVLVLALALLLELGSSDWSPGANDNASGVAVAIALARALDAAPPANLTVTLLLCGAGDGQGIGLRRHLSRRRSAARPDNTIVLGLGPAGAGEPRWLESDGPLIPLAFFGELRRLASETAAGDPELGLLPTRARGISPALPARARGIPALTLGCAAAEGTIPRSHQPLDTAEQIDPESLDRAVRAGLLLVDALDAYLEELNTGRELGAGQTRGPNEAGPVRPA